MAPSYSFVAATGRVSQRLVQDWLSQYMFKSKPRTTRRTKAKRVAAWLSNHGHFMSHGRHIPRDQLISKGLQIEKVEADQRLQDLVLSLHHATTHTFGFTPAVKIIENHM